MNLKNTIFVLLMLWYSNTFAFLNLQPKEDSISTLQNKNTKKKFSASAGILLTHFSPTDHAIKQDWHTPPLNLGGEVLICYNINESFRFFTGVNYQYGKISLRDLYYGDRTMFHELSSPILGDFPVIDLFNMKLILRTGFYFGKYVKIKRETKGGKISPYPDKWYNYSTNNYTPNYICDYYFSIQDKSFNSKFPIDFELFCKYRINKHRLNQDISRFKYGIKVNYKL